MGYVRITPEFRIEGQWRGWKRDRFRQPSPGERSCQFSAGDRCRKAVPPPVGIVGAGRSDPPFMDGPDTKTAVMGFRSEVYVLPFQVCSNRSTFNIEDLDLIDGLLSFPDKLF